MNLEEAVEELNESDVSENLRDLAHSIDCIDQNETVEGFKAALDDSLEEAERLVKALRDLRAAL